MLRLLLWPSCSHQRQAVEFQMLPALDEHGTTTRDVSLSFEVRSGPEGGKPIVKMLAWRHAESVCVAGHRLSARLVG